MAWRRDTGEFHIVNHRHRRYRMYRRRQHRRYYMPSYRWRAGYFCHYLASKTAKTKIRHNHEMCENSCNYICIAVGQHMGRSRVTRGRV